MTTKLIRQYIVILLRPSRFLSVIRHYRYNRRFRGQSVSIGFNTQIIDSRLNEYVWVGDDCKVSHCEIGRHTYIGAGSSVRNADIGAFCSISFNVQIGLGMHPSNFVSTHPAFYSNNKAFKTFSDSTYIKEYGNIRIGNDVLIGTNSTIMFGVTIGDGAVITNNAVVTKDVPPYAIVGGIPAKIIKYRFDEHIIKKLQESRWWTWDEEELEKSYKSFLDVTEFTQM